MAARTYSEFCEEWKETKRIHKQNREKGLCVLEARKDRMKDEEARLNIDHAIARIQEQLGRGGVR